MSKENAPLTPMRITLDSYDGPRFVKVVPAAQATGFARTALRNACREGRVKCVKSGRSYYVDLYWLLEAADNGILSL